MSRLSADLLNWFLLICRQSEISYKGFSMSFFIFFWKENKIIIVFFSSSLLWRKEVHDLHFIFLKENKKLIKNCRGPCPFSSFKKRILAGRHGSHLPFSFKRKRGNPVSLCPVERLVGPRDLSRGPQFRSTETHLSISFFFLKRKKGRWEPTDGIILFFFLFGTNAGVSSFPLLCPH